MGGRVRGRGRGCSGPQPRGAICGSRRRGRGGVAESVVAAVSEARDFFAAGLDRDRGHAGVGGEVLGGGVAGAVIADLGQEGRGADDAVGALEERQEDLTVGVCADGVADLCGEQADLFHDRLEAATSASTSPRRASASISPARPAGARRGAWPAARRIACVRCSGGGRGTARVVFSPSRCASVGEG